MDLGLSEDGEKEEEWKGWASAWSLNRRYTAVIGKWHNMMF